MASNKRSYFITLLEWFVLFVKNTIGTVNAPYETFRKMSFKEESLGQLVFVGLCCIGYFAFASLVRTGLRNPFLLTFQFNKLALFSAINFLIITVLLFKVGKRVGGIGKYRNVVLSWGYTLIPTLIWFFVTSFIYILLPPPRTLSLPGKIFSIFYIGFSLTMLYWKVVLYYVTLRFSLKLDLKKIGIVSVVFALYIVIFGLTMYKSGIFRILFI